VVAVVTVVVVEYTMVFDDEVMCTYVVDVVPDVDVVVVIVTVTIDEETSTETLMISVLELVMT